MGRVAAPRGRRGVDFRAADRERIKAAIPRKGEKKGVNEKGEVPGLTREAQCREVIKKDPAAGGAFVAGVIVKRKGPQRKVNNERKTFRKKKKKNGASGLPQRLVVGERASKVERWSKGGAGPRGLPADPLSSC